MERHSGEPDFAGTAAIIILLAWVFFLIYHFWGTPLN